MEKGWLVGTSVQWGLGWSIVLMAVADWQPLTEYQETANRGAAGVFPTQNLTSIGVMVMPLTLNTRRHEYTRRHTAYILACMRTYMYTMHICMCMHCKYTCAHTTHTYTHIYRHMYTQIHTCTHSKMALGEKGS